MARRRSPSLPRALHPGEVRPRCPASWLPPSTREVRPLRGVVGQARAIEALRLALALEAPGYNCFVTGVPGTGRTSLTTALVRRLVPRPRRQVDYAYVMNFDEPDRPLLLRLEPGEAVRLRRDMDQLVRRLREALPRALDSGDIGRRRDRVVSRVQVEERRLLRRFEERARRAGFVVARREGAAGEELDLQLVVRGRPYGMDRMAELRRRGLLAVRQVRRVRARYQALQAELEGVMRRGRTLEERLSRDVDYLEDRTLEDIVKRAVDRLAARYAQPKVRAYLASVREHLVEDIDLFVNDDDRHGGGEARHADPFGAYRVNVLLEARHREGPPIVEAHPTYRNVFGAIERLERPSGTTAADFHAIRSGALVRADGGVLLLDAADMLEEPFVLRALRRFLRTGRLEIQDPDAASAPPTALKPEPIELDVKVVLVGDELIYDHLWDIDEGFDKLFKVKAEFDDTLPMSRANVRACVAFLARLARDERLLPMARPALQRMMDESRRRTGRAREMSARFVEMADVAREASHRARARRGGVVADEDVKAAVVARDRRQSLLEEKLLREIHEGAVRIHTRGSRVGCVNGLLVLDVGGYAFGKPVRVTATVAPGEAGILNIEREARLSGGVHDKGVLIMAGFLRQLFARARPLQLAASLCFEQSYAGVDGDSASLAECLALLSALGDVPLAQRYAVTGALDQHGAVLAVGGLTEKVEGFFRVVRPRDRRRPHGVLIPAANAPDLMAADGVVEAMRKGTFEVRVVRDVREALAVMAAPRTPEEVLERCRARLEGFRAALRKRIRD